MKNLHASLLVGLACIGTAGLAQAQIVAPAATPAAMTPGSPTRMQVKMERDAFLETHRYDEISGMWMLKEGVEPPMGVRSRAEVKQGRDQFLANNRWDAQQARWVPLTGTPRNMSTLSRATVTAETQQFSRTHEFDETSGQWIDKSTRKPTAP